MTLRQLQASERRWKRLHTRRDKRLKETIPNSKDRDKWTELRAEASDMLAKRRREIKARTNTPRIITAGQLGLTFQYVWGTKGKVYRGAGHYTAGGRVKDADALANEMRVDHRFHKGKGWGGLSYEVMIADDGTIGFGNPINRKSAAVASNNTGMVGICCPGTTGHRMTGDQERSIKWLLDNWHTTKVPKTHRLPRRARSLTWKVHKEWPGQSTACPGVMAADYKAIW